MKVTRMKPFIVLCLAFGLSSCLINRTSIEVGADGAGKITLEYEIADDLLRFAQYDNIDDQLTLPLDEYEFRRLTALSPGLELLKYRAQQRDGTTIISAAMGFASLADLAALFGPEYDFNNAPPTLKLPLVAGLSQNSELLQASELSQISELDLPITFHFTFAFAAVGVGYEFIGAEPAVVEQESDKRGFRMTFSYSLEDLLTFSDPTFIQFTW